MKTLRLFTLNLVLSLALAATAFAGEMSTGRSGDISTTKTDDMSTMKSGDMHTGVTAADIVVRTVGLYQSLLAVL